MWRYQKQEMLYRWKRGKHILLFSSQSCESKWIKTNHIQKNQLICIPCRADKRVCCSFPCHSALLLMLNRRGCRIRPWFPLTVIINWRRFMSVHLAVNTLWWGKVDRNDAADFARGKTLQANQSHQESDKWFQAICVTHHSLKSRPLIYGLLSSLQFCILFLSSKS